MRCERFFPMNATPLKALPQHLTVVLTLAHVLQKLEASAQVDAGQYRSVVQRLADELSRVPADAALQTVLDAHPAAADVYENLNYRHYLNITRVSRPIAEVVPSEAQIFGAFFARHGRT